MSIVAGWKKGKLHEYIELISGQHIDANDYNTEGVGTPYLTGPSDFSEGKIVATKFTERPKTVCKKGDILITVKGSGVGKTVVSDNEYCISRQLMAIRPTDQLRGIIYYTLKNVEQRYNSDSAGLIPGISRADILNTTINFPIDNRESEKIGEILSLWDKAIELKQKLIDQKKVQKKGLMQKLLTGKVGLPGFEGEWEEIQVQDICTLSRGRVISKKEMSEKSGPYPVYSSQTSENGEIGSIDTYDFEGEYVTWTTDGANAGTVFYRNGKFNCTNVCGVLQLQRKDLDARYFSYILQASTDKYVVRHGNPKLMNNIMGIIPLKIFNNYKYQKVVCDFFDEVNREIHLLEREVNELMCQKKGLMQLLLTGKVRVKV
ncbi:restriction endonuclease subunit S [Brevibacillus centrosporus]|uniref:restriction endonuclease subunit S n=1 Tax=Brevibacillus centrosporus TaxID=54910 RepID=UPI003D255A98